LVMRTDPDATKIDTFLSKCAIDYGLSLTEVLCKMFRSEPKDRITGASLIQERALQPEFMRSLELSNRVDKKLSPRELVALMRRETWHSAADTTEKEANRLGYHQDDNVSKGLKNEKGKEKENIPPKSILKKQQNELVPSKEVMLKPGSRPMTIIKAVQPQDDKGEDSRPMTIAKAVQVDKEISEIDKKIAKITLTPGKLKKQQDTGSSRVLKTPIPAHPIAATNMQSDIKACDIRACKFFVCVSKMLGVRPNALDKPARGNLHTLCTECWRTKKSHYIANKKVEDVKILCRCASSKCYTLFRKEDAEFPGSPFCSSTCHKSYSAIGE